LGLHLCSIFPQALSLWTQTTGIPGWKVMTA
jgi:hypothetical protein